MRGLLAAIAVFVVALTVRSLTHPDAFRHLMIRRVPYLGLLALLGVAASPWLRVSFVQNLLAIDGTAEVVAVVVCALLAAAAVSAALFTFDALGHLRLGQARDHRVPPEAIAAPPEAPARRTAHLRVESVLAVGAYLAVCVACVLTASREGGLADAGWIATAMGVVLVAAGAVLLLFGLIVFTVAADATDRFRPAERSRRPEDRLPRRTGMLAGYVSESGRVLTLHVFGALVAAALLTVNGAVALLAGPWSAFEVPAAAYVLLAIAALVSVGSGVTFLLDPGRVPVVIVGVLVFGAWSASAQLDHVYRTERTATPAPHHRVPPSEQPLILVAAVGGGIQAAGWTARAVQGLDALPGVTDALTMMSGASGGAVGLIHVAEGLRVACDRADAGEDLSRARAAMLDQAVRAATTNSLSALSWGLLYVEPFRGPWWWHTWDRGRALEARWERTLTATYGQVSTLADWRTACPGRGFPVVVVNATEQQTGAPRVIAPWRLGIDDGDAGAVVGLTEHLERDPTADLRISTAARVGAAFPYFSPHARPTLPICDALDDQPLTGAARLCAHLADGGYYDNEAVATLLDWVDANVRVDGRLTRRVRLVIVNGFDATALQRRDVEASVTDVLFGPIEVLDAVRTSSQLRRNRQALRRGGACEHALGDADVDTTACDAPPLTDMARDHPFLWTEIRFRRPERVHGCERDRSWSKRSESLSWRLSHCERLALDAAWEDLAGEVEATVSSWW